MKRMAEVGWRKRAATVLPLGMYGHQVGLIEKDKDKDNDLPSSGSARPFHIRHFTTTKDFKQSQCTTIG